MTTIKEAKEKLDALIKELDDISTKITEAEALKPRLRELKGGWNDIGKIGVAKRELRDAAFPVFWENGFTALRIININAKYITIRRDGANDNEVSRYRRDNGWKQGIKSGYDAIDVDAAIRVWEQHIAKNKD